MMWDVTSPVGTFTSDQVQLFMQYVITKLYPKVSESGSRVAVVTCGASAEILFNFTRWPEQRSLISAINAYTPPSDLAPVTKLSAALKLVVDDLYSNTTEPRHRALLLLSQGLLLDDESTALAHTLTLRKLRINIIGIGLPCAGSDFGYLYGMVNQPATSYVSVVETFTELERKVTVVSSVLKDQGLCNHYFSIIFYTNIDVPMRIQILYYHR